MSAVTVVLDSARIPASDRDAAVREAVARMKVPLDIEFPAGVGPVVRGAFTDLGSLRICSCRSNATRIARTAQLVRDDFEPSLFLGLQKSGSSLVVQDGREAILRPGDLVLFTTTAPFTVVDTGGIRQYLIRLPIDRLALPEGLLRQVSAVRLSPGHPVADLAAAYFRRMASRPDLFEHPGAVAVSQPSIDLIRALVTTHLDATALAREAAQATLGLRVLEYVRSHLGDPDLDAARIAAEHYISVRHLYNVLAQMGVSLGAWIRTQRLENCRADLARPSETATIAAVAHRWGFGDASSFGRLFRTAYGLSPREWRAMGLPATA
jgi:AraC-like DNA-binding protein